MKFSFAAAWQQVSLDPRGFELPCRTKKKNDGKNNIRVGPSARSFEHSSHLCKSACVPSDGALEIHVVANVLRRR
ncbi:hypothetical protein Y032_0410g947 [Ancylostoma ceylanicum]|uniref:Uncharacterized protein n=1 Tax=Ancylostoma ceylanicum TaxID=53326 RepID=A0A016X1Y5_9BILA|nr:hypothetical protein Y032_0410g947 [Ancylostoma ceylanicum]